MCAVEQTLVDQCPPQRGVVVVEPTQDAVDLGFRVAHPGPELEHLPPHGGDEPQDGEPARVEQHAQDVPGGGDGGVTGRVRGHLLPFRDAPRHRSGTSRGVPGQ